MSGNDVLESFRNSWRALCENYHGYPNPAVQNAINMLGRILAKTELAYRKYKEPHQISIDEWMQMLGGGDHEQM